MEPVAIGDLRSEYYDANSDFPGLWELDENRREDVDFRNSSSIRIWYNDLTSNYATHWHNALEIIIPIDNYYDVEVEVFPILPVPIIPTVIPGSSLPILPCNV